MITEIKLDIPEDDDTYIKSWCCIVLAEREPGMRWRFLDGWFDFLTLRIGATNVVVPVDHSEIYRKNVADYIERRWWWKLEEQLEKETEQECESLT